MKPTLILLAAGMASRYGGAKQIDAVSENGNVIMDYSVYDAVRAGFGRVVMIIRPELERDMRTLVMPKLSGVVDVELAYQTTDRLPEGLSVPEGRVKPWGTTHALLCAREAAGEAPFAVLNADDLYGAEAFAKIYSFLTTNTDPAVHAMAGYRVENTLSENGSVKRGVCTVDSDGWLKTCTETFGLVPKDGGAIDEHGVFHPAGTAISMNFWGFMPSIWNELERDFEKFMQTEAVANPLACECLLPDTPGRLVTGGRAKIRVIDVADKWYGVTYKEDMPSVKAAVAEMTASGVYPKTLF